MIKLTKENYFSPQNTAISSTKVRDFLKSKELYYKRYVTKELPYDITPSITLGQLVDSVIERGSLEEFKKTYTVSVLKRDNAELFEKQKTMDPDKILTPDTYARVVAISDKILRSPFYNWYRNRSSQFQVPLQKHIVTKDSEFDICGMIDVLTIEPHTIYIDDLKTTNSSSIRSPMHWAYHVRDYAYDRQMAVYRALVKEMYPSAERIICRHFVVSTSKADMFPIKLYEFRSEQLDKPLEEFMQAAYAITKEQRWIDPLPSWDHTESIPDIENGQLIQVEEDSQVLGA
jgi:hypothetical protein